MLATLKQSTPTSSGKPPEGISRPSSEVINIFSAPWGYLTGNTCTEIGASGGMAARIAWAASGLFASIPTIARDAPEARSKYRTPRMTSAALSTITR